MTYIATAKTIEVLGQKFESFITESGEVVFSQSSVAKGLQIAETSVRRFLSSEQPKALQGKVSDVRHKLKAYVGESVQQIGIVTMPDLSVIVAYLAEYRSHDTAVSMHQASFAVMLQQSVDVAYGVNRESVEYTLAASKAAKQIEQTRKELRFISGAMTNPYLACNVYEANNALIYGEGFNRDTYMGEDAARKHAQERALEGIQAGMKMADMPLSDILPLSHEIYHKRIANSFK